MDDNTFVFGFGGIEYDPAGAYIWCVIEDGHYDVTNQRNRISVGNEANPPEIISIPSSLIVEQGSDAEIRCVAKSADESEPSFLWYETETGLRADIFAVNDGTEKSDFLICDTSTVGIRNYICFVTSANGGMTYSSTISVTVTEKQTVTEEPIQPTIPAEQPTAPGETDQGGDSNRKTAPGEGVSWWVIVLIGIAAAGIGFGAAVAIMKKK